MHLYVRHFEISFVPGSRARKAPCSARRRAQSDQSKFVESVRTTAADLTAKDKSSPDHKHLFHVICLHAACSLFARRIAACTELYCRSFRGAVNAVRTHFWRRSLSEAARGGRRRHSLLSASQRRALWCEPATLEMTERCPAKSGTPRSGSLLRNIAAAFPSSALLAGLHRRMVLCGCP